MVYERKKKIKFLRVHADQKVRLTFIPHKEGVVSEPICSSASPLEDLFHRRMANTLATRCPLRYMSHVQYSECILVVHGD